MINAKKVTDINTTLLKDIGLEGTCMSVAGSSSTELQLGALAYAVDPEQGLILVFTSKHHAPQVVRVSPTIPLRALEDSDVDVEFIIRTKGGFQ